MDPLHDDAFLNKKAQGVGRGYERRAAPEGAHQESKHAVYARESRTVCATRLNLGRMVVVFGFCWAG